MFPRSAPPPTLLARRDEPVTYRVRVDLVGAKPPIWRRLEVASDLPLDVVHHVLQSAFGWTDSHLHRFSVPSGSGSPYHDPYFISAVDAEMGEEGTRESEVRLDEVMREPGDRLTYLYDFGDDWEHSVRLEAVEPRVDDAEPARCVGGRRQGPPEDVGGVWGYASLLDDLADPGARQDPDRAERLEWFGVGGAIDSAAFDLEATDAAVRAASRWDPAGFGTSAEQPGPDVPAAVVDLLSHAAVQAHGVVLNVVRDAQLQDPPELDDTVVAGASRVWRALLERVGDEGIQLSKAGYLPRADVQALADALGITGTWIGSITRETDTTPVLELRRRAQKLGLLRKRKGRLVLSSDARSLRTDDRKLVRHVARHLPIGDDDAAREAGLLALLALAGSHDDPRLEQVVSSTMDAIGWASPTGPMTTWMARSLVRPTVDALSLGDADRNTQRVLARYCLSSWP